MWPPKRPVRPKSPVPKDRVPKDRVPEDEVPQDQVTPGARASGKAVRARRALRAEADALLPALLSFLASDEDRLIRFFDLTGMSPDGLRAAAAAPGFATSLLDYVCADDRLVLAFATAEGLDPARLDALHQGLTRTVFE